MRMSDEGKRALIAREGLRLKAYRDSVGVLTIGVGHTSNAGPPIVVEGMTITSAQCDEILTRDLHKFEDSINSALKVIVAQNEFDALTSICFNVGPKFAASSTIRLLNKGDKAAAADAIMLWSKPKEIIGRRQSEQRQFRTPYKHMAIVKPPPDVEPIPDKPKEQSWLNSLLGSIGRLRKW